MTKAESIEGRNQNKVFTIEYMNMFHCTKNELWKYVLFECIQPLKDVRFGFGKIDLGGGFEFGSNRYPNTRDKFSIKEVSK